MCTQIILAPIQCARGKILDEIQKRTEPYGSALVYMAIDKYRSHPSISTIKKRVRIYKQFEFSNIDLFYTISKIQALNSSKASSGNIPTAIIRDAKEVICPYLTSCINAVINNCYFPDKLKEADVTAIHKNGDKCHKQNYRPISVLPNMSKIIERIMSEQITQHFVGILSPLLSGFRQGYNTQHALFGVIEIWKKCLDMSGTIGTILMDLSKAYDCIYHDHTYGNSLLKKNVPCNLRSNELRKIPSLNSQRHGIRSLSFRGSLLWNAQSDEIKLATSVNNSKKEIQQWDGRSCKCHICI